MYMASQTTILLSRFAFRTAGTAFVRFLLFVVSVFFLNGCLWLVNIYELCKPSLQIYRKVSVLKPPKGEFLLPRATFLKIGHVFSYLFFLREAYWLVVTYQWLRLMICERLWHTMIICIYCMDAECISCRGAELNLGCLDGRQDLCLYVDWISIFCACMDINVRDKSTIMCQVSCAMHLNSLILFDIFNISKNIFFML
jgi:hypothetical protein